MKERELREHATCSLCNQRIGHTGLPLFWTVKIERLTAERDELRRQLAEAEQDARRYRDWLRGGANIPSESTRWARWEVRHWDGRCWNTLFAEQMDAAIDAAMGASNA